MLGQFTLTTNAIESKKIIQRLCTLKVSHVFQIGQN
jgi:hypothetical protein